MNPKKPCTKDEHDLTRRIIKVAAMFLYGFGAAMIVITGFRGRPFSTGGLSGHHFLSFNQAATFLIGGITAFLCYWVARSDGKSRRAWLWLAVASAFTVAAYDKMFDFHERAQPEIIKALPMLSFTQDVMLNLYAVAAVVVTIFFVRELRAVPLSARLYVAAFGLFVLGAVADHFQTNWPSGTRAFTISSIVDEMSQYVAGLTFILAFLTYGLDRLIGLVKEECPQWSRESRSVDGAGVSGLPDAL